MAPIPTHSFATKRSQEFRWLLIITIVLGFCFWRMHHVLIADVERVNAAYRTGQALNLEAGLSVPQVESFLKQNLYLEDQRDRHLLASALCDSLTQVGHLENLGMLNKNAFKMAARLADSLGGPYFKAQVSQSRRQLGLDSTLLDQEQKHPVSLPAQVGEGGLSMNGQVVDANKHPMAGVLVRLHQHLPDVSLDEEQTGLIRTSLDKAGGYQVVLRQAGQADSLLFYERYARTDADGRFAFRGLTEGAAYSVLPIHLYYEFGTRKGVEKLYRPGLIDRLKTLFGREKYRFEGHEHQIRLLSPSLYNRLRNDVALTVRTPKVYSQTYLWLCLSLLGSFWVVHFLWVWQRFAGDALLLPILLLLFGFSFLTVSSLQQPVLDTFYSRYMVWGHPVPLGITLGVLLMGGLSLVDIAGFLYTNQRTKRQWISNSVGAFALLLALATAFIGSGPEGSGVQVNLSLGPIKFQPSELIKFLLVLYLAYTAEDLRVVGNRKSSFRDQLPYVWKPLLLTLLILALFMKMGDTGPAMIACTVVIVFIYLIRRNTQVLTAYVALVVGFYFIGQLLPGIGDRLVERTAMWLNRWDNEVRGGDHTAHSIWTFASGGFTGQGFGQGEAQTLPAAHTDMILASFGEEVGWLGLFAFCLIYFMLLQRILLISIRSISPFQFLLGVGIFLAIGLQAVLIIGGAAGLLPLTGVALPFMSYGNISMLLHLLSLSLLIHMSASPNKARQPAATPLYLPYLRLLGNAFGIFFLVVLGTLAWIQLIRAKDYVVRPALVANRQGERVVSYNPRIALLAQKIPAGTIYDRNGLILATSRVEQLTQQRSELEKYLSPYQLTALSYRHQRRYYPFGAHTFFWTGDQNRHQWDKTNGYFAELRHLTQLRGYNTTPEDATSHQQVMATRYRPDRFLPSYSKQTDVRLFDYHTLAPLLIKGIGSDEVNQFAARNRDFRLTLDAPLQMALQKGLAESESKNKRISVVVTRSTSGDVLASAVWPLAESSLDETSAYSSEQPDDLSPTDQDLGMFYATAPGSSVKILTALAGFNKLGPAADTVTYAVKQDEAIRRDKRGNPSEPVGPHVTLQDAIVKSSNVYFIKLANDKNLKQELVNLYYPLGFRLGTTVDKRLKIIGANLLTTDPVSPPVEQETILAMNQILEKGRRNFSGNGPGKIRFSGELSKVAWGQGVLDATPLGLTRLGATIANGGKLAPSRFLLSVSGKDSAQNPTLKLTEPAYAATVQGYMALQTNTKELSQETGLVLYGKTGTPNRIISGKGLRNDGIYVFFARHPTDRSFTVVCIRIEAGTNSKEAVSLAKEVVIPVLRKFAYM